MEAVGLVERRITGDPLEQERNQWHVVLAGQIAIHLAERRGVFGAVVGRRLHAGQNHEGSALLTALDDGGQVAPQVGDGQPPEGVVAPQRHQQDGRARLHHPGQTAQATGRGVTRHAGIEHGTRNALGTQPSLNQRRIGVGGVQTQARREAVAQHGNAGSSRHRRVGPHGGGAVRRRGPGRSSPGLGRRGLAAAGRRQRETDQETGCGGKTHDELCHVRRWKPRKRSRAPAGPPIG